ncbi:protein FAM210B, mitochondrial-like [Rhinatrema bivittatum]|uniref:protein FAM210B, mitochondrial-like n=1 Tax=Rhinatrema bivittatum TaxID=194408 RepID=UPI00112C0DFD|nr:protein FAM210B, mitochondrial-like [Rhinatrema bivittatum]
MDPSGDTRYGATDPSNNDGKTLTRTQKLKQVFKEYGAFGVLFHVGISLMSLVVCYLIIVSGVDIASILIKLGVTEALLESKVAACTSNFVLAYAIHKLFTPACISITLVSVPFIVRNCRKIGLLASPAP